MAILMYRLRAWLSRLKRNPPSPDVDPDEVRQREAEDLAAALGRLGWASGAGASVWARAARDELQRHEEARGLWGENGSRELWERLHATAFMVAVSVDLVLAFETRVRKLTGDAELQMARQAFDRTVPQAEALRDLIAHLDEYAVGKGQRQTGKRGPALKTQEVSPLLYWMDTTSGYRSYLSVGDTQIQVEASVEAAVQLAEVVERVRERCLHAASDAAQAAFRLRFPAAE